MKTNVLIVDDDQLVRSGLGVGLEDEGFAVHFASSAEEAFDVLPAQVMDALLVDIYMDGMDGIEMLKTVREQWPLLPVIIITGHGSISTVMEALHFGANDYLLKPLSSEEVGRRIRDVLDKTTAVMMAEKAQSWREKLFDLQQFAAGIAHDLNNHLTVISSSCQEALSSLPAGHPAREELHWIQYSANAIEKQANRVMSYSGGGALNVGPVALDVFLPECVRDIEEHIRTNINGRTAVRFDPPTKPLTVIADPAALREALRQVLINAGEAAVGQEGDIRVAVRDHAVHSPLYAPCPQAPVLDPGQYACIEVKDFAGGMPRDVLTEIFDPFFSTKFQGRGLGLPQAQSMMMAQGGGIHVHSEEGIGTTVMLYIPRAEAPALSTAAAEPAESGEAVESALPEMKEHIAGGRILIVEDEEVLRLSTQRMLKRMGEESYAAKNGKEALKLFHEQGDDIDLVVLDMTLPDIQGDVIYAALRREKPELKVILTSGYAAEKVVGKFGEQDRPDAFIQKPYKTGAFVQRVKEMLDS